jgi:glutathione S-transferase
MSLTLHFHPLSSFSQKVVTALYETGTPFTPYVVDFFNPVENAKFKQLWPIGKIPVLRDDARDCTLPETTVIIEYLAQHYPGPSRLIPADPDLARQVRLLDRVYDLYVDVPMQKIVTDRLRPEGQHDSYGVAQAKAMLEVAYGVIDQQIRGQQWAVGDTFTLADCAAAPALYYANLVVPFGQGHRPTTDYFQRLMERPSFARAVKEAEAYRSLLPV